VRIVSEVENYLCEALGVRRRCKELNSGFPDAFDVCAHDREARRHAFEHAIRTAFGTRTKYTEIYGAQQSRNVTYLPCKANVISDPQFVSQFNQRFIRAVVSSG
jgi:hypothetical protein